jgi:hypothetical protein
MFSPAPRPRWARTRPLAGLIVALCALLAFGASAAAGSSQPVASSAALRTAVIARVAIDRTLASSSKALAACLREHPADCQADRLAVKRARAQLTSLDGRIAKASRHHKGSKRKGTTPPISTPPTPVAPVTPPTETGSKSESPAGTSSGSGSGSSSDSGGSTGSSGGGSTEGTGSGSSGSTEPSEPGNPVSGAHLEIGINAGSALGYELHFIEKLGAHTARMAFGVNTPVSEMEPIIEAYARAGVKPLLLACFTGYVPSAAEAENVASWAAAFGAGGTFWKGKSFPASVAVTDIEFGNETNYSYQFAEDTPAAYASRAQTYALRVKEAHEAIQAAHSEVGILAQGDLGNAGAAWVQNMFKAVPNLGQLVAGWTIHPYGPSWESRINATISATQAAGAPSTLPIYVTEWGLTTDNGPCLSENFGWNKCMTYSEAGSTLSSAASAMRARYGSRLGGLYIYEAHDLAAVNASTNYGEYFGALQSNGEPKGAYTTAVESLLAEDA